MNRDCARRAFTLIELIVAIVLIALLLGLLLPVVQWIRESEARIQCENNLKQIVLAAHNYASATAYMPSGWLGPNPNTSLVATPHTEMQAVGCLCLLLPFLEYQKLWGELVSCAPSGRYFSVATADAPWYDLPMTANGTNMLTLATTQIPVLLCPSDQAIQRANGCILWQWGPITTATNGYPQNFDIYRSAPGATMLGRTNYTGVGGIDQNYYQEKAGNAKTAPGSIWAQFDGIMTNRSQLSLEQITSADGCSNTLLFGELLGDSDAEAAQQIGYSVSWMCGSYPTYCGLPTGPAKYPDGSRECYWTFGSRHKGVVEFGMCDGAVRPIKKGAGPFDTNNYQVQANPKCMFGYYSGWRDGGILDPKFIGN